jgi:hypothetical protein
MNPVAQDVLLDIAGERTWSLSDRQSPFPAAHLRIAPWPIWADRPIYLGV